MNEPYQETERLTPEVDLEPELEEPEFFLESALPEDHIELGAESEPIPQAGLNPVSELAGVDLEHGTPELLGPPSASRKRRTIAKLIDWTLTGGLFYGGMIWSILRKPDESWSFYLQVAGLGMFGIIGAWATWFVYNTIFKANTLGKMLTGIHVVDERSESLSFGKAFSRSWAETFSGLFLGLGYLFSIFDLRKRGLHDHLCGTRVVRRR